jgi:glycosyltransferase involved in cell wall biosynthesis
MHIVFNSLSLSRGGAERVIISLCGYLIKTGNQITIITSTCKRPMYRLPEKLRIVHLDTKIEQASENKLTRFIRRRKKLTKVMGLIKPDIAISFLPEPNFLMLSLSGTPRFPIIISIRNDPALIFKNIIFYTFMRVLYTGANGIVFQTEAAKEYFNFSDKIIESSVVLPNPVKKDFIGKVYTGMRRKLIVSVGRLEPQKNHMMLIKAFSLLDKKYDSYILTIYGEGSLRTSLSNYIIKLGLDQRVTLAGEQSKIQDHIIDASLFVLSSNNEGMPNALIEAMCLGLPVVSTDCAVGGPAYLIEDGTNGLLCKVNDSQDLKLKMESILGDENIITKFSNEAVKLSERLNPDRIGSQWEKYIKKIYDQGSFGSQNVL